MTGRRHVVAAPSPWRGWRPSLVLAVVTAVDLLAPGRGPHPPGSVRGRHRRATASFLTTIERKWSTNVRLLGRTVWTWMVPIAAAFMVYVLVIARGWQRLLPTGSALRAGVLGTLTAGLVGGW